MKYKLNKAERYEECLTKTELENRITALEVAVKHLAYIVGANATTGPNHVLEEIAIILDKEV